MEVIISCTEMISKKTVFLQDALKQMTEAEQPMDAQLNSNDAGLKLFRAACSGDACKVQALLSASSVQSYINYTDEDGRTPLFKAVSKGDILIVAQLIAAHCNVDMAKTTDGATPLHIAAHDGHACVTRQLIEANLAATSILR